MAKYNYQNQVVHTDMLQTPVVETPTFDFRIKPHKVHDCQAHLPTSEQQPTAGIELNLASGRLREHRLRMKRGTGNLNDCSSNVNDANKMSKLDASAATFPHLNLSNLSSPFLKSPLDDLNITPIDLRTPTLHHNDSNNGAIIDSL